jgi:hypothetical protein
MISFVIWRRSSAVSRRHTLGSFVGRMLCPPDLAISLEDGSQLFKSSQRKQCGLRPRDRAQIAAGNGHKRVLARDHLDSAISSLIRKGLNAGEFQNPAE